MSVDLSYDARHDRVRRSRGRAKDYQCARCDQPAGEWATIHGRTGFDPQDYEPLCIPCHRSYDRQVSSWEQLGDLDHGSPAALWEQIAAWLRGDITSGRLTGRVPSATALAMSYGVSRDTALRALAQLASEGLTVARRGRGTFVVPEDDREH
jgi:hypothetical protein